MIKTFVELGDAERLKLYEFLDGFEKNLYYDDYAGMVKVFEGVLFSEGRTLYTYWLDGKPRGTLGAITKEIKVRKEIFITNIYTEDSEVLVLLLDTAISSLKELGVSIKLGLREDRFKDVVEDKGFLLRYKAIVMRYEGQKPEVSLSVRELNNETEGYFRVIHNEAFLTVSNGAVLEREDMQEILEEYGGSLDRAGIVYQGERPVGMYQLVLKDGVGWIEAIAVAPKVQGKGFGRDILRYCISRLKNFDVKLVVMSSNEVAYRFYERYGFLEEKVLSNWYEYRD